MFGRSVQMSPSSQIFEIFTASLHRLGFALGATRVGTDGVTGLAGSGARESMFMVGFITMDGAMLVLGACVIAGAAISRFGQNLVMSHQRTPSAVRPAPENTHSLF